MRNLDRIIQPFVSPVVGLRCRGVDGLDVAAQLVRDHDPWLTKLSDQSFEKPLGRLCTRISRTAPFASMTRYNQCFLQRIVMTTSPMCHL